VPEFLTCFACDNEPTRQCSRCGRPYCDDHGEELCDACLQPASGVPSFTLYRGSLLALLIGTALAVWLLVQPTNSEGDGLRPVVLTPTSTTARVNTPGPQTTQAPGAVTTPGAAQTPVATRPAGATMPLAGTTPAAGGNSYTVESGDTLLGICGDRRPNLNSAECVTQLRSLNGITGDDISVGQTLRLP